jgi:GAF domain-containing protein
MMSFYCDTRLTRTRERRIFLNLFTGHAASAVTNAMAREEERKRAEVSGATPLQQWYCCGNSLFANFNNVRLA